MTVKQICRICANVSFDKYGPPRQFTIRWHGLRGTWRVGGFLARKNITLKLLPGEFNFAVDIFFFLHYQVRVGQIPTDLYLGDKYQPSWYFLKASNSTPGHMAEQISRGLWDENILVVFSDQTTVWWKNVQCKNKKTKQCIFLIMFIFVYLFSLLFIVLRLSQSRRDKETKLPWWKIDVTSLLYKISRNFGESIFMDVIYLPK